MYNICQLSRRVEANRKDFVHAQIPRTTQQHLLGAISAYSKYRPRRPAVFFGVSVDDFWSPSLLFRGPHRFSSPHTNHVHRSLTVFQSQWLSFALSLCILLELSAPFHVQRLRLIKICTEIRQWCRPEYFIARLGARICRRGVLRKCEINRSSRSSRSSMAMAFCALTEISAL